MTAPDRQTLGKYELVREIGRGSMGIVYLGRDPFTLRDVAIKVSEERTEGSERHHRRRRKLFYTEARAAGMLRHPNIISTVDAGIDEGLRYLVMEYVPGAETLARYCRPESVLPVPRVVSLVLRCALALAYAHEHNVVHRDIKPSNVILTQHHDVKLCDFGIAMFTDGDLEETQVVGRLGSPRYMSPEQVTGETVTAQSDIFSLGVVLYEMLTGRHPFAGRTLGETNKNIARESHPALRDLRPEAPAALARIVDRMLKKHPAGRYRSAMEIAGDLGLVYDEMRLDEQESGAAGHLERLRELAFFGGFDDADLLEVLEASRFESYRPGAEIVAEGESGEAFWVLVSGEVSVQRGDVEIDRLGPGASFGEIGFLSSGKRTASIVAAGSVTALHVEAGVVPSTSLACQLRFQRSFLRTLAERFTRSMESIDALAGRGAGRS